MDYFLESVKIMLIVAALSAFISMLVAWIIKLLFAAIRRQSASAAAKLDAAALASAKPASDEPGKAA